MNGTNLPTYETDHHHLFAAASFRPVRFAEVNRPSRHRARGAFRSPLECPRISHHSDRLRGVVCHQGRKAQIDNFHNSDNSDRWQLVGGTHNSERIGMTKLRIEYSHTNLASRGYTEAEIRANIAETTRRMALPGAKELEARRKAQGEQRAKGKGIKFPDLARNTTTKPSITKHHFSATVGHYTTQS
jgi:hypothetical protein